MFAKISIICLALAFCSNKAILPLTSQKISSFFLKEENKFYLNFSIIIKIINPLSNR